MTQRLHITVNTERGEIDYQCSDGNVTENMRKVKVEYPDWTSMVVTVVRVNLPAKPKPKAPSYHPTEFEKEREEHIYELRNQGMKFVEIAKLYGVSPNRIAEIQKRTVRRKRYEAQSGSTE